MGLLAKIALGVLAISFMTFVAFFGRIPALRHTPIAWLHRAIWIHIPNGISALDQAVTGGRVLASAGSFGHYVWYGRHPTVLIFYVLLLSVGEYLYLPGAWPRLGRAHQVVGAVAVALPYAFLYLAAFGDPGVITASTHARYMALYPYDHTLFHPGQECRTCRLLKPARSKHCAVCKRCVAKLDHHCVFINNCVGYGNQHWFLLLLLSTAFLTTYGGALGLGMVAEAARARSPVFSLWKPPALSWHHYFLLLTFGLQSDVGVGSVTLLAVMTSPLVWGLLGYQTYLIYCGTTTNESMKWQDWQAEMDDGFAFRRSLLPSSSSAPRRRHRDDDDGIIINPRTRWPVEPVQMLVRTEDGEPPNDDDPPILVDEKVERQGEGKEGEEEETETHPTWERVWHLRDIENIYDIGFWDNLLDVFVPHHHSFRPEAPYSADLEKGSKRSKKKSRLRLRRT